MFGAILGGVVSVASGLLANGARKRAAKRFFAERGTYTPSKYISENRALAQNAANARSAGVVAAEGNIRRGSANTLANVARASTSSSQLLAAAGGVQQNEANSFAQLATQEEMDRERRQAQLMGANQDMAQEERLAFQDRADALAAKYGVEAASIQSNANIFSDLGKGLMYAAPNFNPFKKQGSTLAGGAGSAVGAAAGIFG